MATCRSSQDKTEAGVAPQETRASRNTHAPGLRFRALPTEDGDPRVQPRRARSSPMVLSANFAITGF
jgi:hypothetical protein